MEFKVRACISGHLQVVFLKEVEMTAIHRFVARVMMVILITALLLSLEMTTSVKVLQHPVHGGPFPPLP